MELLTFEAEPFFKFILLVAFLIAWVLFLLTQQNTLRRITRQNRRLRPGMVWLQLIPFLGQIWQFFVIVRISNSIRNELAARQEDELFGRDAAMVELGNKRPSLATGLPYCIIMWICLLTLCYGTYLDVVYQSAAAENTTFDVILGLLLMACPVLWVIYWVNLALWKRRLKQRAGLATG